MKSNQLKSDKWIKCHYNLINELNQINIQLINSINWNLIDSLDKNKKNELN